MEELYPEVIFYTTVNFSLFSKPSEGY